MKHYTDKCICIYRYLNSREIGRSGFAGHGGRPSSSSSRGGTCSTVDYRVPWQTVYQTCRKHTVQEWVPYIETNIYIFKYILLYNHVYIHTHFPASFCILHMWTHCIYMYNIYIDRIVVFEGYCIYSNIPVVASSTPERFQWIFIIHMHNT